MTASWVVWSCVVSSGLGLSALFAESALRERGWPTRWPWAVALSASVVLPLHALWWPDRLAPVGSEGLVGWTLVDPTWLTGLATLGSTPSPGAEGDLAAVLTTVWMVATVLTVGLLVGGLMTLRSRSQTWHRARVQGEHVLLSPDFGPALVGVVHPEIVLPRWALALPEEDQRLACLHEAEHRDARDTWLLMGAALCAAAMPWNPTLWWQLRRLRAAVEVDCDTRVLARGASRRAYGSLLLELGTARGRIPLPMLALARSESLLERRLKMIVRNVGERRPLRSLAAVCLSGALFVLACDTPAPTTVDGEPAGTVEAAGIIEAVEVPGGTSAGSGAVGSAGPFSADGPLGGDLSMKLYRGELRLLVDGEEQDAMPEGLDPTSIERVEVQKDGEGAPSTIQIFTRPVDAEPLVLVDGVRLEGDLSALSPEDIERVEVLKGEAALDAYGEEGRAGVIRVTLKKMEPVRR